MCVPSEEILIPQGAEVEPLGPVIDVQLIEIPVALPVWFNQNIRQLSKFLSPGPLNQLREFKLILCPRFFYRAEPTQNTFLYWANEYFSLDLSCL